MPEALHSFAVKQAAAVFGHEDQMDMHGKSAVSAVSQLLVFIHGPDHNATMERRQAFQFELMPNSEQRRQMRRFAGCARYVYNKAQALKIELYEVRLPQSVWIGVWPVSLPC